MIGSYCVPTDVRLVHSIGKKNWKPCSKGSMTKTQTMFMKNFAQLRQKGFVSEYTHEWEVLTIRQSGFSGEKLLRLYRCGLKDYIREELKLHKPKSVE